MAEESGKLAVAIAAIRAGDKDIGRQLILEVLAEDPDNEAAWSWACDVAETTEERIHCLRQIVSINPSNEAARSYLARLEMEVPPSARPEAREVRWRFLLLQWAFPILLVLIVGTALVYYRHDILSFFGLAPLDFDSMTISRSYDQFIIDGDVFQITFEPQRRSEFSGVVRHASAMRVRECPILTHDILVTSGDYANPDIVTTRVSNHHFTWRSAVTRNPSGRINLLHTVPATEEVYRQLLEVRTWDEVVITGREILTINRLDENGKYLGDWRDSGCNTLLVQSVTIGGE
ncbi:MAG: hypothetical protein GTO63_35675 [Anaerolineae bacterium]|nr:hypothetical protein [Anaerolineae bacterium]NIO00093.1 hypothetical protein [Anaerolineae bacterium]NIQ80508.1 hypothetical protein [Anaerolineae bacterium]